MILQIANRCDGGSLFRSYMKEAVQRVRTLLTCEFFKWFLACYFCKVFLSYLSLRKVAGSH